jgi:SAM-dependent methyltransferase
MKSWVDYWNSDHPIYVNERHKRLHAEAVGRDIARFIRSADAVVLDHGCGEALYAETVASGCSRLVLCEAAPAVRERLASRLAGRPNIQVIDDVAVGELADRSIDLVVANSLVQYLSRGELEGLLSVWRSKLKPAGELVIADVIPPDVSPLTDAAALLRFGWSGGFLGAALLGLAKTVLSDYRKLRATLGFSTYTEKEFLALLSAAGYRPHRVRPNFGHNQARMTFRATLG